MNNYKEEATVVTLANGIRVTYNLHCPHPVASLN